VRANREERKKIMTLAGSKGGIYRSRTDLSGFEIEIVKLWHDVGRRKISGSQLYQILCRDAKPTQLEIGIGNTCGLECKHCFLGYSAGKLMAPLTPLSMLLATITTMIESLGTRMLCVTDRDALTPHRSIPLFDHLAKLRNRYSDVKFGGVTNGLTIHQYADDLERIHLDYLDISIEGERNEHEQIRGAGTFDRVIKNLRLAISHQLADRIIVSLTLTRLNDDSMIRLIHHLIHHEKVQWFDISPLMAVKMQAHQLQARDLADFLDSLYQSLQPVQVSHPVTILVELCAYCAAFLPALVDSGWLQPHRLRQDHYGHLYQDIAVNSAITITLRPELLPEYWRHTLRISADGYVVGSCEPLVQPDYTQLAIGNIQTESIQTLYSRALAPNSPFQRSTLAIDRSSCRDKACFAHCLGGDSLLARAVYGDYDRKDPNCTWDEYRYQRENLFDLFTSMEASTEASDLLNPKRLWNSHHNQNGSNLVKLSKLKDIELFRTIFNTAYTLREIAVRSPQAPNQLRIISMTDNSYFEDYVERVQNYLAMFSLSDEAAEDYLHHPRVSAQLPSPKFFIFEILFNHIIQDHQGNSQRDRKFDPHVSNRLMQTWTPEALVQSLHQLYARDIDWQAVQWASPEAEKLGVADLSGDMDRLSEIYARVCALPLGTLPNNEDLQSIETIFNRLILRYEVEYAPTNLAASALIYEAWRSGKLRPLDGHTIDDHHIFTRLLRALFINTRETPKDQLLTTMAADLGLEHLTEMDRSTLLNGDRWLSTLSGREWFGRVESALIHRFDLTESDYYLIHYPLIIDGYWFAGFTYLIAERESVTASAEIFQESKYAKFYSAVKSVSETLRFSLRFDALSKVPELVKQRMTTEEIFLEVVKDYFVCFNVRSAAEPYSETLHPNRKRVYSRHGVSVYGPNWLTLEHRKLIAKELDGGTRAVGLTIPGLYEAVAQRQQEVDAIRLLGRQDQASILSHQTAGLVAEVWNDLRNQPLGLQARGCLWQLKTLIIDLWGNLDLEADRSIRDGEEADFPEFAGFTRKQILETLMDVGIIHALRRAAYRRAGGTEADNQARTRALQMRRLSDRERLAEFKRWVGLEMPQQDHLQDYPDWLELRGFVLCFHHCFWQAAYHGFRARCDNALHPCLQVVVEPSWVTIFNANHDSGSPTNPANGSLTEELNTNDLDEDGVIRDRVFFERLEQRTNNLFSIEGPRPSQTRENQWETIIRWRP
jgi:MoaA/NifB/PqqE/SkfB family radical SAM enzyme